MIREVFHIGSFSVSPFGVMLAAAFLCAYFQLRWGMQRLGIGDEDDASLLIIAGGVGGIVGAKVYFAILYRDWHALTDRAGLVWYGGFIVGALAVLWVIRYRRLSAWGIVDAAGPALALGYAVGRIGCFLVGDDYGLPTDSVWGVKFPVGPSPSTAEVLRSQFGVHVPASVPDSALLAVHPTQLYETAMALVIWGVGIWLVRREPREGTIACSMLALLAVERFLVEFLRAKDDRLLGMFTLAQAWSVALLVVVGGLWLIARRRSRPAGAVPGA